MVKTLLRSRVELAQGEVEKARKLVEEIELLEGLMKKKVVEVIYASAV